MPGAKGAKGWVPRVRRVLGVGGLAALLMSGDAAMQAPAIETTPVQLVSTDGPVYSVAWAPDGRVLASVAFGQVNLWRPGVDTPVATFSQHTSFVRAVAFSPNGASVASVGEDVRIWRAETREQTAVLDTAPARSVAWSPDGTSVAVGGESGHLQVWRVADRQRLHSSWLGATISSVSWSPDGRKLAVGAINAKASIWDATTGRLLMVLRATSLPRNDVNGISWSPHGRLLATAQGARGAGDIQLWDPETGKLLQRLTGGGGWLRALSWSLDGEWIASGGEDGQVRIWNVQTGAIADARRIAPQPIWTVAWSPDGRVLAAGAGAFNSRTVTGTLARWPAPLTVLLSASSASHARSVETALLERGRGVATPVARPALAATTFRDGGAHGTVIGPDPPFGNLETSFVEADIRAIGIGSGGAFQVQCREKAFLVMFGRSWDEVAAGEWAAFLSLDGTLVLARNTASAAAASGCVAGDPVFISK